MPSSTAAAPTPAAIGSSTVLAPSLSSSVLVP